MGKAKKRKKPSTPVSSSDSSDSDSSGSRSASSVSSTRDLGGDRDDSDASDLDIKDQYLPKSFQPKPPKSMVTKWAKNRARGPYLGTKIGKDERSDLTDRYYCSPEDHKLFAAPKLADSPLAQLFYKNSSAQDDLIRVNSDLLFGIRVGLLHYEKCLDLKAMWGKEKSENGQVYPPGAWHDMGYSFRSNFPVPVPYELRRDVQPVDVANFLQEPFIKDVNDEDKLGIMAAYALSYREGFNILKGNALRAHDEAMLFDDSMQRVQEDVDNIATDIGNSLRLFGNACQLVKEIREFQYVKPLDDGFKRFINQKMSAKTQKEKMESRAGGFIDDDLVALAKTFGKEKKAMDAVSKEKQNKERVRRIQAAKKAEAKDKAAGAGTSGTPSSFKSHKNKKNPQGKNRKPQKAKKATPKKKTKNDKDE